MSHSQSSASPLLFSSLASILPPSARGGVAGTRAWIDRTPGHTQCPHILSGAGPASARPAYRVVRVRSVVIAMYHAAIASSATSTAPTAARLPRTHIHYLHRQPRLRRHLCLKPRTPPLYRHTLRLTTKRQISRVTMLPLERGQVPIPLPIRSHCRIPW